MMLTVLTQAAIAILHDIASGHIRRSSDFLLSVEEVARIVNDLERKKLIRQLPDTEAYILSSYCLCQSLRNCSLLEILEATDEPIYSQHPLPQSYDSRYGTSVGKLFIVNQLSRQLLSEVNLADL